MRVFRTATEKLDGGGMFKRRSQQSSTCVSPIGMKTHRPQIGKWPPNQDGDQHVMIIIHSEGSGLLIVNAEHTIRTYNSPTINRCARRGCPPFQNMQAHSFLCSVMCGCITIPEVPYLVILYSTCKENFAWRRSSTRSLYL